MCCEQFSILFIVTFVTCLGGGEQHKYWVFWSGSERGYKMNTRHTLMCINISTKSSKTFYQDILIFNHLPNFIKNSPSIKQFKCKLKALLGREFAP